MPRSPRIMPAGFAYHVLNRANGRAPIFAEVADARRFVATLVQAVARVPEARLLAWCLMPNHWHLVFHPSEDDVVQPLLQWLTLTHTQRHRAAHGTVGDGPLYQGRYKSFPIATDDHLLTVIRYVERNPVRAGLVSSARSWQWSSAAPRSAAGRRRWPALSTWPIVRPADWPAFVDRPRTPAEEAAMLDRLRATSRGGQPFGPGKWAAITTQRLGLGKAGR